MNDLKSMAGFTPALASSSASTKSPGASSPAIPADQFESIFYSMMIKQMRQTVSENGLFPGEQSDSYGSLFDMFMGQHLAEAQPLGIAQLVTRYQEAGQQL